MKTPAENLFFHHHLSKSHVCASLDLPHHLDRVDGTADVMGQPEFMDLVDTGFRIAFDFGNTGGVAVVWRRTNSGSLEFASTTRRSVASHRTEGTEFRFGPLDRFGKIDCFGCVPERNHPAL